MSSWSKEYVLELDEILRTSERLLDSDSSMSRVPILVKETEVKESTPGIDKSYADTKITLASYEHATACVEKSELIPNNNTVAPPVVSTEEVTISNECLNLEEINEDYDKGPCARCIQRIETALGGIYSKFRPYFSKTRKLTLVLLYLAYFSYCMHYRFGDEGSIALLVITLFCAIKMSYKFISSKGYTCDLAPLLQPCTTFKKFKRVRKFIRFGLYFVSLVALGLFLGFDILKNRPENSQSILGIVVLVLVCFIFSKKASRVNWHPVYWGFIIQFSFAIVTLRSDYGYRAFQWVGDLVQKFTHFSDTGAVFVLGKDFQLMGLAFTVSSIIIFFNGIIYLLTHWGVTEVIVIKLGRFLSLCLETGPVESVIAASNIFLGSSEAALLIRPYLPTLSKSELCAVMTCGFASVSGGIMGMFIQFGAPANHLLTAAVISAPAGLAFTKVICPETERVNFESQKNVQMRDKLERKSSLSVLSEGAMMAVTIIAAIMANMIAFVSVVSMLDAILNWIGERAGISGLRFELICSYVFYPLSYVMGVIPEDCLSVGSLIGIKLFATPVLGYVELGKMIKNREIFEQYLVSSNGTWHWSGTDIVLDMVNTTLTNGIMTERSEVIATYAMCGFSAVTSLGITIAAMNSICPSRKEDVVEMILPAFFAGNMASFATGAVAGVMYTRHSS